MACRTSWTRPRTSWRGARTSATWCRCFTETWSSRLRRTMQAKTQLCDTGGFRRMPRRWATCRRSSRSTRNSSNATRASEYWAQLAAVRLPAVPMYKGKAPRVAGPFSFLRRDVGDQLALQHEDLVLQHELAFLQALQLELVVEGVQFQRLDGAVQVPVLEVELADAPLDLFGTLQSGRHGGASS